MVKCAEVIKLCLSSIISGTVRSRWDSPAWWCVWELYQDQLAVVGELSGPGRLGSFSLQQSLLAADFTVRFPAWKTLKGEEEAGDVPFSVGTPKTRKVEQANPRALGCSDGWRQRSAACVCFGDGRAEASQGKRGKE